MTDQARVVVIGGGVMGCALAYHLAAEGWTDLILLEKAELTSGTTWHAAGQIAHSVSHRGLAKMAAYGTALCPCLEAETGQSATWHGCGSVRMPIRRPRSTGPTTPSPSAAASALRWRS